MSEQSGLIFGYILDGTGGGSEIGWSDIETWEPADGMMWLHLDRTTDACRSWLGGESGLDLTAVDALLAEETRPRTVTMGSGLLVILRGVNLNPGADPEDMVSIRMWIEEHRVITISARTVMAVGDMNREIQEARGPRTASEFMVEVAARLVSRMAPVVDDLDDLVDGLEDELLTGESRELRHGLRDLRRTAIALRRYLAPQRDAMAGLQSENISWFEPRQKARMREVTDRLQRFVEDLDEVRDRAAVVQDELMSRLSEQLNRNMYLLSVVAAIMLPLGLVTGLLGINVGGIPGAESSHGFLIVCAVLSAVAVLEVILVRRLHWI